MAMIKTSWKKVKEDKEKDDYATGESKLVE